jgi:hypothetical protein
LTAKRDWYRDRPELEAVWRGTVRRREVGPTPGGRDRLPFELAAAGAVRPIYGPAAEAALLAAVDHEVDVEAKLVDLGGEGLGAELWVADGSAVRRLPPDATG